MEELNNIKTIRTHFNKLGLNVIDVEPKNYNKIISDGWVYFSFDGVDHEIDYTDCLRLIYNHATKRDILKDSITV